MNTRTSDRADSAPTLVALIPQLMDEKGHYYAYARAVERACLLNGWRYCAALPCTSALKPASEGWSKCLYTDQANWRQRVGPALLSIVRTTLSVRKFLRSLPSSASTRSILFIDSFDQAFIVAAIIGVLLVRKAPATIWLFCRYGYRRLFMQGRLLQVIGAVLRNPLLSKRLVYLTDSKLLEQSYAELLSRRPEVMPIPHTHSAVRESSRASAWDDWILWWPGEPREHKGWSVIRRLAACVDPASAKFRLVVAECAGIRAAPQGIRVEGISNPLTMDQYAQTLGRADIILLPYDPIVYEEATSGIFVESIVAGKIPLVSGSTWMAFELERFNLKELILDWTEDALFTRLLQIARSASVRDRLASMRREYGRFHNEPSYARRMADVYLRTR